MKRAHLRCTGLDNLVLGLACQVAAGLEQTVRAVNLPKPFKTYRLWTSEPAARRETSERFRRRLPKREL